MVEEKKDDGNGKLTPEPQKGIKVMMIKLDVAAYAEFLKNPKVGTAPPVVEVMCDFLYDKTLWYGMLEGAKEAIFLWNMAQAAAQSDPSNKDRSPHRLLNFIRGRR